jgi:hypothetical protein
MFADARSIDTSKAARRGPAPLPPEELRSHCVSVRLSDAELASLDAQRAPVRMRRGEYLRCASLHRLPPVLPAVNVAAWVALSKASGLLNQIAHRLHQAAHGFESVTPDPDEIAGALAEFRRALICAGASLAEQEEELGQG